MTRPLLGATIPPVTVGMPVYNGERQLEQAVKSLLAQTEGGFSLIISDNGSTDQTPAICRDLATDDPRITYVRHDTNRGAAWNFNYVFELAKSPFFMWAAADDLWEPAFLEKCLTTLLQEEAAILAFSALRRINSDGEVLQPYVVPPPEVSSVRVTDRVAAVFRLTTYSHVYGLMRRPSLARTKRFQNVWGTDLRLLLELSLLGPCVIVPEVLYSNRVYQHKTPEDIAEGLSGPRGRTPLENATSRLFGELVGDVLSSTLTVPQEFTVLLQVIPTVYDANLPWRGGLLADLAGGMRSAYEERRVLTLARKLLWRSLIEPRTPWLALKHGLSSLRDSASK